MRYIKLVYQISEKEQKERHASETNEQYEAQLEDARLRCANESEGQRQIRLSYLCQIESKT